MPDASQPPRPQRLSGGLWVAAGPAPDRISAGAPTAFAIESYASPDGLVSAGFWRCTPGRWRVVYDETEYCRIIGGEGFVHPGDGEPMKLSPGDEIVIPSGFVGEWEVTVAMTKTYVSVLPPPA